MEPDTTIIAGASSWRGTFTQCGGIPRMMAGSMVVAAEQHGGVLALLAQRRGLELKDEGGAVGGGADR